ncbi:hypothetical protein [Streptomyces sp. MI02-7b]|uniref:hypothetical protein n=1 Tax=Streptomyces sp. MI02-7b TaxID=462941 RepID=UPI0029AD8B08|nr:hypothetical protein [Streptomyces sp. MI02-7b]MDX3075506.1 hypothetical protein [Streptomyces sp. MI02-7b]
MTRPEVSELDHLREIERLARAVRDAASSEGLLSYSSEEGSATALQRTVNALARGLRRYHFQGDGCLGEEADRPLLRLAGVVLLRPEVMPAGMAESYEAACTRLGVEARPEGWALWNTWGDDDRMKVTMVVSAVDTTEGPLANWSRGRALYPVVRLPSQVALIHNGWARHMIFSPFGVRKLGLGGQP